MTLDALQAELDRGHLVAISAEYPAQHQGTTTVVFQVRGSAERVLELLDRLRRIGLAPRAFIAGRCAPALCEHARPLTELTR